MKRKWLIVPLTLLLIITTAIPVLAATLANPATINSALDAYTGINYSPSHNSFYALDRHWVFWTEYADGFAELVADLYYSTSPVAGNDWDTYEIVTDCGNVGLEFSVWYDADTETVHYVRVSIQTGPAGVDEIVYRAGTLNADGTITWLAAEQDVATTLDTNVVPCNHHVNICVDFDGYPWIAYVDDDGVDDDGDGYVVSSSTKNGTFTPDVTDSFSGATQDVFFVSIIPYEGDAETVHFAYSYEETTSGEIGMIAHVDTGIGGWEAAEQAVEEADMHAAYTWAFDLYSGYNGVGDDDVYLVYTDVTGDVLFRIRDGATWDVSTNASNIKDDGLFHVPCLSGYRADTGGDDLIVFVHSGIGLLYRIWDFGTLSWGDWVLIWQTPDIADDDIYFLNSAYKYSSPVGFVWQYDPDPVEFDDSILHYWWIDNVNNTLGWYATTFVGVEEILGLIPLLVVVGLIGAGVFFIVSGKKQGDFKEMVVGIALMVIAMAFLPIVIDMTTTIIASLP